MRSPFFALLAIGTAACTPMFELRGNRLLAPRTRVVSAGGRSYVRVDLELGARDGGEDKCQTGDYGVGIRVVKTSYGRLAQLWIPDAPPTASSPDDDYDHDVRLQHELRRAMDHCSVGEYYDFATRYLPTTISSARRVIVLTPGMRIRLERGGGLPDQAFYGAGTVFVDVVGARDGIFFDASSRVRNVSALKSPGILKASLPIDLNAPAAESRFLFWRVIVPKELSEVMAQPDETLSIDNQFFLVGADRADVLDDLLAGNLTKRLQDLYDNRTKGRARCVAFPGHTYVAAEIPVTVQEQPRYIAVGATLGDVAAAGIDRSRVGPTELRRHFEGRLELYRRFGAELRPVRIPFDRDGTWARLPLAQGDVVRW